MEESILIWLDDENYDNLVKVLESNPEKIYFQKDGEARVLSLEVKYRKQKDEEVGKQQNIVENWMNQIDALARAGYDTNGQSKPNRYFQAIMSYCDAVITSVTS